MKTKIDYLIEYRKICRGSGGSFDFLVVSSLSLVLWYGFNNKIATGVLLLLYILGSFGLARKTGSIDELIEIEINTIQDDDE